MNRIPKPHLLGAVILLLAAAGLAMYGQPDLKRKWEYLAPEYQSRLTQRDVFIDPGELLHLMNDDYIELVTSGTGMSFTWWTPSASLWTNYLISASACAICRNLAWW
jgi:hypothetical protein